MNEVLAFLKDVDVGSHAASFLELIQSADLCFVALVVTVLICLGYKMVAGNRAVFSWGLRLAALVFLVYGGVSYFHAAETDARSLGLLAARSALLAGASLALIWIVFPVLVFIYAHLRLALTAFLIYGGYAVVNMGRDFQMDELPGIALRSLVAAGLAVVVAWICQPIWLFLLQRFGKPKAAPPSAVPHYVDEDLARRERKELKRWKKRRRHDDLEDGEEVHTLQIEMRRRRDKARLTVELTYAMTMSELNTQLPRDMFESWISRYLGDHLPPEDVEENSKQLQALLSQQRKITQQMSGPQHGSQLEDLNLWFLDEQRRIQNDPDVVAAEKQRKLLDLQQMYTSLVNRLLGDHQQAVVQLPYRPAGSQGEAM